MVGADHMSQYEITSTGIFSGGKKTKMYGKQVCFNAVKEFHTLDLTARNVHF